MFVCLNRTKVKKTSIYICTQREVALLPGPEQNSSICLGDIRGLKIRHD